MPPRSAPSYALSYEPRGSRRPRWRASGERGAPIAAIFRIELPKLVARLARVVRDVGRAEELAQDAMVIALERWPAEKLADRRQCAPHDQVACIGVS